MSSWNESEGNYLKMIRSKKNEPRKLGLHANIDTGLNIEKIWGGEKSVSRFFEWRYVMWRRVTGSKEEQEVVWLPGMKLKEEQLLSHTRPDG